MADGKEEREEQKLRRELEKIEDLKNYEDRIDGGHPDEWEPEREDS